MIVFAGGNLPLENQLLRFKEELRAMGPGRFKALEPKDFGPDQLEFHAVFASEKDFRRQRPHHQGAFS